MFTDLVIGIYVYSSVALFWGAKWSWLNLFLTIFFSFFPDSDFIIFALLRKKLKLASHHIIHFPVMLIPVSFVAGYWWVGFYGAALFSLAVLGHFFHDSYRFEWEKTGIRWLWPFCDDLFYFDRNRGQTRRLPFEDWKNHLQEVKEGVEKRSLLDEIMHRIGGFPSEAVVALFASLLLIALNYYVQVQ